MQAFRRTILQKIVAVLVFFFSVSTSFVSLFASMGTSCARALVKLYLFLYCRPPDCCVSPAGCTDSVMRRITRRRRIIPRFHTVKEFLHQVNNSKKEPNWDLNNVLADLLHSKTKGVGGGVKEELVSSLLTSTLHLFSICNAQERKKNKTITSSLHLVFAFSPFLSFPFFLFLCLVHVDFCPLDFLKVSI